MTVQEVLNIYLAEDNYVDGSMINKSFDDEGCVYKWLSSNNANSAFRREIFIHTSTTGTLEDRIVINYIEIADAR